MLIETIDLTKTYSLGRGNQVHALSGVDLRVAEKDFISIMGPSGSGKSTLLNMLGCLDRPSSGQILIDGEDVSKAPGKRQSILRGRKIGFVFQEFGLIPTLNAIENVALPLKYQGVRRAERHKRAEDFLERVGLGHRMRHRPIHLSGGEQQRVAVARALASHPAIVLADEPTGELDSQTGKNLIKMLRELNQEMGITFILVTHDQSVADSTDRVVKMLDGKISFQ